MNTLESGIAVIQSFVKDLPLTPGVYRMLDEHQRVLYVGKAKNLRNRVTSYTQRDRLTVRLKRMVAQTVSMEFVHTNTEAEALLLEANLIKKLKPTYNIRLMDDKNFAYIHLSNHPYPRLAKYRGSRAEGGQFYGPFVSVHAITAALDSLYRIFKIRSCGDHFFATRKRPCLQYHIKRCSAPCVAYVDQETYAHQVSQAIEFLEGHGDVVRHELINRMEAASGSQAYEQAAALRDQISALNQVLTQQNIHVAGVEDADIFALVRDGPQLCIHGFFFRQGANLGSYSFFPSFLEDQSDSDYLASFLSLFYADHPPAKHVIVNISEQLDNLEKVLTMRRGDKVYVTSPQRGDKKRILDDALHNAKHALARHHLRNSNDRKALAELSQILALEAPLERVETYDNSHIQGSQAIGAMVVGTPEGFAKKFYRKFTITGHNFTPGDDYAMMAEVLKRRFTGSLRTKEDSNPLPDLLLIDGGLGQVKKVQGVLTELNLEIPILGVAKGPERNKGDETFYRPDGSSFKLNDRPLVLYYIQRLRDEAHRFAITFHRAKRQKALHRSTLDDIPNVGPGRKKALLQTFGSAKAVQEATLEQLCSVKGISQALAQQIYDFYH